MEFAVDAIAEVAARDESIARVLREICALDGPARRCALDLVAAHLGHRACGDVLECIEALRGDELASELAERLGAARWEVPGASQVPPTPDARQS